jgi:hypothetical protein
MERLTNKQLETLETAWRDVRRSDSVPTFPAGPSFGPAVRFTLMAHDAVPALLAELRDLRRLTTPEPISEKHRDGNWWLVWEPGAESWFKCRWRSAYGDWQKSGTTEQLYGTPTHALPLPGSPEPYVSQNSIVGGRTS